MQPIPVPQGDDNKHGTRSRITHAASLLRRALSPRESGAEAKDKDAGLADEPEALPSGANSDEVSNLSMHSQHAWKLGAAFCIWAVLANISL